MATKYRGAYPDRIKMVFGADVDDSGQKIYTLISNGGERVNITAKLARSLGMKALPAPGDNIAPFRDPNDYSANPAPRKGTAKTVRRAGVANSVYVTRRSQITRKSPTKRLRKRRITHVENNRPEGYFPNPIRGIVSHVGVINDGNFQSEMSAVTPVTFEFSTAEKKKYYRCFALPNAVVRNDDFQTFAKNSPRLVVTLINLKSIVSAFQK